MSARDDLGEAAQRNRIALYIGDGPATAGGAALRLYFQGARAHGLRIVTVKREAPAAGGRRPVLKRLVARMEAGEFEAIVTVMGAQVAPMILPTPAVQGDSWISHPAAAR